MRIRLFLACVSTVLVGAGFGIQACGGSSDDVPTTADAAPETASHEAAPKDSAPGVDAAPACDPTKDLLKDIPDASIADGASSTGVCLGCTKAACGQQILDCQTDCSRSEVDLGCQALAADALECYAKTQSLITCGAKFISAKAPTQDIGFALAGCVGQKCSKECGVPDPDAGAGDAGDAGPSDAGDSG
jgi:hypothetical protein